MTERACVINIRNACPTTEQMRDLGATTLRSIIYGNDDLERFLPTIPPGVKFIALMNNEHEEVGEDWRSWGSAIQSFAYRFKGRVWGLEMTNEWDLHGMFPGHVATLVVNASPYLQDAGMQRILGAVAGSNWAGDLTELTQRLDPQYYDYANIHPYGQYVRAMGQPQPGFAPGLAQSVIDVSDITGKGVIVTEFGAKIIDYGGEERQAQYVTEAYRELDTLHPDVCPIACYFAWRDDVGAPHEQGESAFGLTRTDNSLRPAYYAFQSLTDRSDPCAEDRARVERIRAYANRKPYTKPSQKRLREMIA
jgi:hypothetical protein